MVNDEDRLLANKDNPANNTPLARTKRHTSAWLAKSFLFSIDISMQLSSASSLCIKITLGAYPVLQLAKGARSLEDLPTVRPFRLQFNVLQLAQLSKLHDYAVSSRKI